MRPFRRTDGNGKAPAGVAALAKKCRKPVIAFAGKCNKDARKCNQYRIDAYFPILREISSLEDAMEKGKEPEKIWKIQWSRFSGYLSVNVKNDILPASDR